MPTSPVPLTRDHDRSGFCSSAPELDEWLIVYARQNGERNTARTFVSLADPPDPGEPPCRVVGYYSLAVTSVDRSEAPGVIAKGSPQRVGCLLLARLAVDEQYQSVRLGAGLLQDALRRAAWLSDEVGMQAVLVHSRDETAQSFYLHIAEFLPSEGAPLQLWLPMSVVRAKFR